MRIKFLIGLALAVTAAYSITSDFGVVKLIAVSSAAELGYAPQVSNERKIKVTATPQNLQKETRTWDFEVALETHTQDLSDDLSKSSVLIMDGKQYLPLVWEGAPPGGHHRKGLLRFKSIESPKGVVELQIHLTGDTSPRSFKWLLHE